VHRAENGNGNLEGSFAANWSNLDIKWVEDRLGDSLSVFATDTAVYKAGHPTTAAGLMATRR
jgi:hypothetical protein